MQSNKRWTYIDGIPAKLRATVTKIKYGSTDPMVLVAQLREEADKLESRVTIFRNNRNQGDFFSDSTSNQPV